MIDLYILIPAVIAQIFVPFVELVILIGTQTKEANAEIETQPVAAETKKATVQHNLKYLHAFFFTI